MQPKTIKAAKDTVCPFKFQANNDVAIHGYNCDASDCMAWRTVHSADKREDHSGNDGRMAKWGNESNRIVRREGPPGCGGYLILDEVGVCARLAPETLSR